MFSLKCDGTSLVTRGKESTYQRRRCQRWSYHPWVGKIPWSRKCNPRLYSCLENPMERGACGPKSMDLGRVGHNWVTNIFIHIFSLSFSITGSVKDTIIQKPWVTDRVAKGFLKEDMRWEQTSSWEVALQPEPPRGCVGWKRSPMGSVKGADP